MATENTEIMSLHDTIRLRKITFAPPRVPVPQSVLVGILLDTLA